MKRPKELKTYLLSINSLATKKAYEIDINQFFDFMEDTHEGVKNINGLNSRHAKGFIEKLKKEKWAPKTINRKLAANLNFYEYLISHGSGHSNIWNKIKRLDDIVRNPTASICEFDVKKMLDAIDGNEEVSPLHQAILFTLFTTGIKKGELINLKVEDFQKVAEKYFLIINRKKNASTKIALTSKCASKIVRYLDDLTLNALNLNPSDWLFRPSRNPLDSINLNKSMNPKSIDYIIKTWCNRDELGAEISSHSARKACIERSIGREPYSRVIRKKYGISFSSIRNYKISKSETLNF